MNFDGVMKITIPEGPVKKIECAGKVLWEKVPELVCNPYISIEFSDYTADGGNKKYFAEYSIKGISRELITSLSLIVHQSMISNGRPVSGQISISIPDDADTIDIYTGNYTYSAGSSSSASFDGFSLTLNYKDKQGNDETLSTDIVSSVGEVKAAFVITDTVEPIY